MYYLMAEGRRGLAGMDALILFIAILLSVSVTAALLINTSSSLVNKGRAVQKEKAEGIQKPIVVEHVRGIDDNGDRRLDRLRITVHLRGGDETVDFNGTTIIVNSKAITCTSISYGHNSEPGCSYNISYGKRGPNFEQDYLNTADLVEIDYAGPNIVQGVEDQATYITIIPSHGMATDIRLTIPARISPQNMGLWPLNG